MNIWIHHTACIKNWLIKPIYRLDVILPYVPVPRHFLASRFLEM